MDGKVLARLLAVIAVAVALTATAVQLTREDPSPATPSAPSAAAETPRSDPLRDTLRRCQQMGEAATRDPECLAAWDESRRRFIEPGKGF